ncbi:MAG: M28 family peptidase, partial [Raoultibacter sp.]
TPEPVRMPAVKQQVAAWQAARSARSDSTTAMQPIDVEALRQQASAASEPECAPAPESAPASMPQSELQPEPAPRTRARRSIRFGDEIADLVSAPLPQPRIPLMDEPSSSGFEHVPAPEKRFDEPVDAATQFIDSQLMAEQQVAASPKSARKLPIVLPDVSPTAAPLPSIAEVSKQRAPLAEAETCGKTAAKSLLSTMIPEVSLEAEPASLPDAPRSVKINPVDIPSLSGVLKAQAMQENAVEPEPAAVSATGSFVPIGATGSFAPVGDALLADVAFEDRYIDDADDSAYAGNVTETGAFAGPGYVDMPKSRARKFLDKFAFRKKSKDEESTPQEWLEVDDDFDARSAGAARGGWDSFQAKDTFEDTQDAVADTGAEIFPEIDDDGFAPLPVNSPAARNNRFGGVRAPSFEGVGSDFDAAEPFEDDDFDDETTTRWHGGAFSRARANRGPAENSADGFGTANVAEEELRQIYQFKHPDIDTEVWFVSLGSELAGNAGMYAFLREHASELKGSVFINLEALGAGDLSYVEKEGKLKKYAASSRMKRYIKKASQASGVSVATTQIGWKESAASVALKHGAQAMSLVGMAGKKPAFYGQGDDVLENLDEEMLQKNADFVMEMLKNI